METVKNVMTVISGVILIGTFFSVVIKPIRLRIIGWVRKKTCADENDSDINDIKEAIEKLTEMMEKSCSASQALLRNSINHIYYKYFESKEIPLYDKENLIELYSNYHSLNGNHYIDQLYEETKTWTTIRG